MRPRIPLAWVQLSVPFTLLAALTFARRVDPDLWWHLRTGELIVKTGIPRSDPFSWTAAGEEWTVHEWLSEAILYLVTNTLGYAMSAVLCSALVIGALVLMYALARRTAVRARTVVLFVVFASIMFVPFIAVRPQVVSWFLFSFFVFTLWRFEDREPVNLWVLPPLMLLWANLHLGFVYGLLVVACWLISRLVARARGESGELLLPIGVSAACVLATIVNPSGIGVLTYPFRYLQDSSSTQLIAEWKRPNFLSPIMLPYLIAMGSLALAVLTRRIPLFVTLLTIAVLVLGAQALRNLPFVVLLFVPVVSTLFPRQTSSRSSEPSVPLAFGVGSTGALIVALTIALLASGGASSFRSPSDRGYPLAGATYVHEHYRGARLYNEYTWGGFVIYQFHGELPVFIDGRSDFYRSRIIGDYAAVGRLEPGWEGIMNKYRIEVALIRKRSRLADRLRLEPGWREVFVGEQESVFARGS